MENQIKKKGCYAENQPGFAPDYRTVEEMLRRKLHDADAMIHIVGSRFGAEPNQRPTNTPRRSYTQMEFDMAREMHKPVYVFLSTDPSVRDAPMPEEKPEEENVAALQIAHRKAVQNTNHLYYFFKDKAELCKLVAEIPPVQPAGFQADISRIIEYAPDELIGREAETQLLNDAWMKVRRAETPRPHILSFVALGGEGKTSLVAKWVAELAHRDWPGCDAAFAWSFYSQGTRDQPTLEALQPLYQAVAHGCQAGLQQEACTKVYHDRIQRGQEAYSTKKLGALGSDLGAVAYFFATPWCRVSPALTEADQAWLLNEATFSLCALGRLTEALDPMRAGLENNLP